MKLNLGSNTKQIEGFINVDALPFPEVDEVWDLTKIPYPFAEEFSVDEILSVECLEHISFRDTYRVLSEWYRIMKVGGKLKIQVPDIEKMIYYYVNNEICECVPHKAESVEGYKADPECPVCKGTAKVNINRWAYAFTGAQKHKYDIHKNIFTPEILKKVLAKIGFINIVQIPHIYKLIIECEK